MQHLSAKRGRARYLAVLFLFLVYFLAKPSPAFAWEAGGCLGPFCYYTEQGCIWAPVLEPGQTSFEPVTIRGKVNKLSLYYGVAEWYGGAIIPGVPVPLAAGAGGGDYEQDWHIYFGDDRCLLRSDGSCDTAIQQVGKILKDQPTPFVEQMTIRKWERVEDLDWYLLYADWEVDWYYWSQDMTHPFLLKPGVMSTVDTLSKGSSRIFTAQHTDLLGKEAMVQGYFVIDNPGDQEDHGHSEIHPMDSLAVLREDRGDKGWTYRVSAFTNSLLHLIGKCSWVQKPRTVTWNIPLPDAATVQGKEVNITMSPLWTDNDLAGPINAVLTTQTVGGKSTKVVRLTIPMKAPDEFGGLWVGDLDAAISDVLLKIAAKGGYPKSLGYFDKANKNCAPCVTAAGVNCAANTANQCRHRYEAALNVVETSLPFPNYQWYLDNKKQIGKTATEFQFTRDLGKDGGAYTATVRLDANSSQLAVSGQGSASYTVAFPVPQVAVATPPVKLSDKTRSNLVYKWGRGAQGNEALAKPHWVEWYHRVPGMRGLTLLSNKSAVLGTITSSEAKKLGYYKPLHVVVRDAYHAEVAEAEAGVSLPRLEVATEISFDAAKVGKNKGALLPPFTVLPSYSYHTTWRLKAKAAMMAGDAVTDIPVTWPVNYQWTVVTGAEHLASNNTPAADTFILTFKDKNLQTGDCVTVRLSGTDQYGHAASYDASLCGGLTNEETLNLMAWTEEATEELRQTLKAIDKNTGQPPVLNLPPKPIDPFVSEMRTLYYQHFAFARSLNRTKAPLSRATLARAALMGSTVTKIARLNPAFLEKSSVIGKRFYWNSAAQRATLQSVRHLSSAETLRHYDDGFASLDLPAIRSLYRLQTDRGLPGRWIDAVPGQPPR